MPKLSANWCSKVAREEEAEAKEVVRQEQETAAAGAVVHGSGSYLLQVIAHTQMLACSNALMI